MKFVFHPTFFYNAEHLCEKWLKLLIHKCVSFAIKCRVRRISYQIKFPLHVHTAECAIVEKSHTSKKGMREESSEFLSSVVSFYRTYFKALWNRKKKKEGKWKPTKLHNKKDEWLEWGHDLWQVYTHIFVYVVSNVAILQRSNFFFCFIFSSSDLCRLKSYGDQFIVSYQKFNLGRFLSILDTGILRLFLIYPSVL